MGSKNAATTTLKPRPRRLKLLFYMAHPGHSRNFEAPLRLLAERGHHIHIAFDRYKPNLPGQSTLIDQLATEYPNLTFGEAPGLDKNDPWALIARQIRVAIDYIRYLDPRFAQASKLRGRVAERVPRLLMMFTRGPFVRTFADALRVQRVLASLHRAIPPRRSIIEMLLEQKPDIVLVTPLLELGLAQPDYVKAARALGIRSCLLVASWDNLTTKGIIHDLPDLVTVWNAPQKREAVELHGVPPKRVAVTGACAYDHWFDWVPRRSRSEFCERVGLHPERPFVLYVGSSEFIAPKEGVFIETWSKWFRKSKLLADFGLLVRPHPTNALFGRSGKNPTVATFSRENVVVWPPLGANPTDADSRSDYFDSIYHSVAVVGVNTSALIESAIVGRRVFTIRAPEFRETQDGTLHFLHLLHENGGPLTVAESLREHLEQLEESVRHPAEGPPQEFLRSFIRPFGLAEPATPRLVAEIELLANRPARRASRAPALAPLLRPILWCFAVAGLSSLRLRRHVRRTENRLFGAPRADRPALSRALGLVCGVTSELARTGAAAAADRGKRLKTLVPGHRSTPTTAPRRGIAPADPKLDVLARLERLAASDHRILAGPWLGDAHTELLHWIPFLRWAVEQQPSLRGRLVAASVGGVEAWYRGLATDYIELTDLYAFPRGFLQRRTAAAEPGLDGLALHPQMVTAFASLIQKSVGEDMVILNPPMLVRAQRAYGYGLDGRLLCSSPGQLIESPPPIEASLPADFVVVRFTEGDAFCRSALSRETLLRAVSRVPEECTVVILDDETAPRTWVPLASPHAIIDLRAPAPEHALGWCTAVISRARGYLGGADAIATLAAQVEVRSLGIFDSDHDRPRVALPLLELVALNNDQAIDAWAAAIAKPPRSTGAPGSREVVRS